MFWSAMQSFFKVSRTTTYTDFITRSSLLFPEKVRSFCVIPEFMQDGSCGDSNFFQALALKSKAETALSIASTLVLSVIPMALRVAQP